ncbi:MAG: PQQ-binding-like beta-propeller repeat protein [Acidobacteriota bacterium]
MVPRVLAIILIAAANVAGADWPGFRGPARDNISPEKGLFRSWPAAGPKVLWSIDVADGYAGAAIKDGLVYVNDYDMARKAHLVRAISLATGKDVWQWSYAVDIRPNHGISRTVPSVGARQVFSLDPKCRFHALDAKTGKLVWQKNLVQEYKATIPGWYAGQNPLLDGDRVIVATGGAALAVAFDQATGKEIWRAPNPGKDVMSHASLMPAAIGGVAQYLYLTMNKVVGIAAADGQLLWSIPFAAKMAACPSPISIGDGRIFITSGYEAGSMMIRVQKGASGFTVEKLYDLTAAQFNSEVHTPILHQNHLFAVGSKTRGRFTCLGLDGKVVWQSPVVSGDAAATRTFELGAFLLADGMFFVLDGRTGMLRLIEASTKQYTELASAQILSGEEVWGPMALSNGKLVIRDMHRMVCLQVGPSR